MPGPCAAQTLVKKSRKAPTTANSPYSHSIVPEGFEVTSRTRRLIPESPLPLLRRVPTLARAGSRRMRLYLDERA